MLIIDYNFSEDTIRELKHEKAAETVKTYKIYFKKNAQTNREVKHEKRAETV